MWRVFINHSFYIIPTKIGFELHHPLFDATILKQGAQLVHFQPKGEDPLLWSALLSTFETGKAFRGGIPLCWPWFGKGGIPSHGFARIVEWNNVKCIENEEGIELVFELCDSVYTRTLWPYTFTAHLTMHLRRDVRLCLEVNAEKESTAALHTYLACKHISDVTVKGLGNTYEDALQGGLLCESEGKTLHVSAAIDRVYTKPEKETIFKEAKRKISVMHENYSDVVVWNPWEEGVIKLSDMKKDDYTKMLCIESARIIKPFGEKDTLAVKLSQHCV